MILATTRTIAQLPHLDSFVTDFPNAVAGWGRKPSGRRAVVMAKLLRRPFVLLEDGFIRSIERASPTLSLLIDDIGVYYDSRRPSRMEKTIAAGLDGTRIARARTLIEAWRANGVSKYNHNPNYQGELTEPFVLVVDQTAGDLSITGGQASAANFTAMLAAALSENPGDMILVKVHPDVLSGRKVGHVSQEWLSHPRVRVIAEDCHPVRLLRFAKSVYTVTSLMGFEALLWGKAVRCFGLPFYAGWGLTIDEMPRPIRRHEAELEDVVHAALVGLARYVNPADGLPWQAEQAIDHVARRRRTLFAASTADEPGIAAPPVP